MFSLFFQPSLLYRSTLPSFPWYDLTFHVLSIIPGACVHDISAAPTLFPGTLQPSTFIYLLHCVSLPLIPHTASVQSSDEWILSLSPCRKLDAFIYDAAVLNYMARKDEGCKVRTNSRTNFCSKIQCVYQLFFLPSNICNFVHLPR